jgi:hypothetical protein
VSLVDDGGGRRYGLTAMNDACLRIIGRSIGYHVIRSAGPNFEQRVSWHQSDGGTFCRWDLDYAGDSPYAVCAAR